MKFEIYNQFGVIMATTESVNCVKDDYKKGNLQLMKEHGWKFKIDGKLTSLNNVVKQLKLDSIDHESIAEVPSKPKRKVRKIKCLNTDKIYKNMSECAKDISVDPAAISYVMSTGKNEYKEFKFEFVNE